jgi:predicted amidophosphoribosyltransferase
VFAYEGLAKQLVVAYKFGGRRSLAAPLCDWLDAALERYFGSDGSTVVPVPASPRGRRKRGFDQAAHLAAQLRRRHGTPVWYALRRSEGNEQKRLDFRGRSHNLSGSIGLSPRVGRRLRGGECVKRMVGAASGPWSRGQPAVPAHVVLLDDVFTTGATISECARVLKAAGVERVDALTLAAD